MTAWHSMANMITPRNEVGSLHTHIHGICEIFPLYTREEHMGEDKEGDRDEGMRGNQAACLKQKHLVDIFQLLFNHLNVSVCFLCPGGVCGRISGC